jgi:hypothetical protein
MIKTKRLLSPVRLAALAAGAIFFLIAAAASAAHGPAPGPHGKAEVCKAFAHRAKVESDPFGTDLAYLRLRQRVCFDGHRVTDTGRLVAYPEITDDGTASNWKWEGWTREPFSRFKAVGDRPHGSRVLFAAGQFSQRVYKYTSTAQVWVKIRVYGDGYARRLALNG